MSIGHCLLIMTILLKRNDDIAFSDPNGKPYMFNRPIIQSVAVLPGGEISSIGGDIGTSSQFV